MNAVMLPETRESGMPEPVLPARVVFLTHFIPLYQVRVLQEIARRVRDFHVLLSTPIEPNRQFEIDWGGLDVQVQKTLTFRRRWTQAAASGGPGFSDPLFVHVPYDTRSRLARLKPDIVMSLELGARSLGAVRYCRRHAAKSIVCTYMSEHTEQARGVLRKKLREHLIRRADAITFNGPSCESYLKQLGADPQRLYRLSYAADDRTAHQGAIERDESAVRNRLLYVGQLSERKGVIPMIQQLAEYCRLNPNRDVELRLAGQGPRRESVERFDVPENLTLRLLGNLTAADLAKEMLTCGATVAPTLADEWLLVVNEALHAGLPVIGSIYAQATTSLIRDGENGWQYDPADPASLHTVLDQYYVASDERLRQMRESCQRSIAHCTPAWAAREAIQAIADLTSGSEASQ
ncbi:MAG: glycosyltransferase family 4 protein [Planctomycetota bacterium]